MKKLIKKSIVLVIMFIFILSAFSIANNMFLKQTTITFIDKKSISFMSSKDASPEDILKKNNISLLEDEKLNVLEENNSLKLTISKKEKTNQDESKNTTLNTNNNLETSYNSNHKEDKIETTIIEIPFNTVTKNLATNSADTTSKIVKEGKNGKREITSRNTYVNNKLVDSVEISSKILEEPIDKIIQVSAKSISRSGASITRSNNRYNYSDSEIDLLCAITAQECSTSYDGALAVITTAMNRASSSKWQKYGKDPLSQYKAKNQFTYSIDGQYKKRLNGNYKSFVKQAILDALNGKRNHNYLSFNSASTGRSGKIIGDNVYF